MVMKFGGFVNYDDDKLKGKNKSALVKWLIKKADSNRTDFGSIANGVTNSLTYFNNKIYRSSFSISDLVKIAHIAGFNLAFVTKNSETFYLLDPLYFLGDEEFEKCEKGRKKLYEQKHDEYLKLKAELEQMAAEYGFKD